MSPGPGLPVRRSRVVETDRLAGVVVEVDPTQDPSALAVLQAGLHAPPEGSRLGFGYDLVVTGLGAWVRDRRLRLLVWPVLVDGDGAVTAADPEDPDADVLRIDFDPVADRDALDSLVRLGRVIVAAPDSGPVPLVVDVDPELVARRLDDATT